MFKLIKKLNNGVRIGELSTPHGVIRTPFFMPVGTVGSVKGVAPRELEDLGAEIVLSNTYHLYLRPGEQLIKKLGGLHQFMNWYKPILTDSGGYQVFSLAKSGLVTSDGHAASIGKRLRQTLSKNDTGIVTDQRQTKGLVKITEDGILFKSHLDGSKHLFTPEKVIQIQLDLGVDILMPLDVCPSGKANREEVKEATDLTVRWAERAKKYLDEKIKDLPVKMRPMLHGIVQGGMDPELRKECARKLIEMDFDGYSVGGLAVDLETRDMWQIVKLMGEILPENKQRYLMGVGTPDDIIKATSLGMDMFDCVLPTRLARHGSVYVKCQVTSSGQGHEARIGNGEWLRNPETLNETGLVTEKRETINNQYELINLLNSKYRTDPNPIDVACGCPACSYSPPRLGGARGGRKGGGFSRAYISHLIRSNEILGLRLATLHNLWQYLNLMGEIGDRN